MADARKMLYPRFIVTQKAVYKFCKFAAHQKKKYINARISYLPAAAAEGGVERRVAAVAAGSSILRASFARRKTLSSVIQDAVDMFGAYG